MRFNVTFSLTERKVPIRFEKTDKRISFDFKNYQTITIRKDAEYYEGEYEVTPRVEAQTLETKNKLMTENIEILKIPFFSTSNNSGGNTVYIGSEV